MRIGTGSCKGTFGELVQGVYKGRPFLITFPIQPLQSEAIFVPHAESSEIIGASSHTKAIEGCNKLLKQFAITSGGSLHIQSNIPVGKGMASSSADIIAALKAVADSHSLPISEEIMSHVSIEIEPTDGVMYDKAVAYDYRNGCLLESFGSLPSFLLIGMDTGGTVDTVQFNNQTKSYTPEECRTFAKAYDLVRKGIHTQDLSLICQAATMSAQINQRFLQKPCFHEFQKLADTYGGGIVTAHSGTVLGILMHPQSPHVTSVYQHIVDLVEESEESYVFYAFVHRG